MESSKDLTYLVGRDSHAVPKLLQPEGDPDEGLDIPSGADHQHGNAEGLDLTLEEIDPTRIMD